MADATRRQYVRCHCNDAGNDDPRRDVCADLVQPLCVYRLDRPARPRHSTQMGTDGVCGVFFSAYFEPGFLARNHGDPGSGAVCHLCVRDHWRAARDTRGAQTDVLHLHAPGAGPDADRANLRLPDPHLDPVRAGGGTGAYFNRGVRHCGAHSSDVFGHP